MDTTIIETHYLPSVAYLAALRKADRIMLEKHEYFVKQTYRNRCFINTSQGKEMLTVPLTGKHGKVLIKDIQIDHGQKWLNNHWRTIQTAYGNSPFFEHYEEALRQVLFKKNHFLYDLNCELLSLCLTWLRWDKPIGETTTYEIVPLAGEKDLRNSIIAKNNQERNKFYNPLPYSQVFGNKFVTDLSIIDLIFCTGPQANQFI